MNARKLWKLFLSQLSISCLCIGGGYAAIQMIQT